MLLPRRVARARLSVLAVAAALVGALAAPAGAALPEGEPSPGGARLHLNGTGVTWTAATVTTPGSAITSRLRLQEVALPLHLGARLYDAQGALLASSNTTLRTPEEGVLVQTEPAPGTGMTVDELETRGDGRLRDVEGTFTVNPAAPAHTGRLTLVLWVASRDAANWDWQLDGGAGTRLLGSSTGPGVFLATSRDFATGPVNAAGGAYAGGSSLQARAQVLSTLRRTQRSTFIGSYYPVLSSADNLSVDTPQGRRQCVPDCQFGAIVGPGRAQPGSYVFRLSGAGAGGAGGVNAGDVIVAGAEVVLPVLG